jgi:3D (Asp-Asp-Asp) domain-containing protein
MPSSKSLAALALVVAAGACLPPADYHAPKRIPAPAPRVTPAAVPTPRARPVQRRANRSRPLAQAPVLGQRTDTTCYTATGSLTASGKVPSVGMAANNRYRFGTVLHVQGYGDVVVEDRIGWGTSLDLFFADEAACRTFGRRQLRVST